MQEVRWQPNPRLSEKENAFVREVLTHPKQNRTESVMKVYNTSTRQSAATLAHELKHKPHIIAELAKYSNTAETNLIQLANVSTAYARDGGKEGAMYAAVSERVNNSILDRLHGKATQKIEAHSQVVTLNIDLAA